MTIQQDNRRSAQKQILQRKW